MAADGPRADNTDGVAVEVKADVFIHAYEIVFHVRARLNNMPRQRQQRAEGKFRHGGFAVFGHVHHFYAAFFAII